MDDVETYTYMHEATTLRFLVHCRWLWQDGVERRESADQHFRNEGPEHTDRDCADQRHQQVQAESTTQQQGIKTASVAVLIVHITFSSMH